MPFSNACYIVSVVAAASSTCFIWSAAAVCLFCLPFVAGFCYAIFLEVLVGEQWLSCLYLVLLYCMLFPSGQDH
jgi:hypothetical protein